MNIFNSSVELWRLYLLGGPCGCLLVFTFVVRLRKRGCLSMKLLLQCPVWMVLGKVGQWLMGS